jgi:Mor family transcriptional regulator
MHIDELEEIPDDVMEKFYITLLGDTAGIVPAENKKLASKELLGMLQRMQGSG